MLAFTLLISLFTGILFGIAPALAGLKLDLNASLKERAPSSSSGRRGGISQPLVALQFALAMLLLIGAGLLGHSFVRLLNVNPGFNPENLLTMRVFLSPAQFPQNDPKAAVVLHQMLEQIRAIPGVRSAGVGITLPTTGGPATDFEIQGRSASSAEHDARRGYRRRGFRLFPRARYTADHRTRIYGKRQSTIRARHDHQSNYGERILAE